MLRPLQEACRLDDGADKEGKEAEEADGGGQQQEDKAEDSPPASAKAHADAAERTPEEETQSQGIRDQRAARGE